MTSRTNNATTKPSPFLRKALAKRSIVAENLMEIYRLMDTHFGDLHWWPADTKEEIVIGAILVQNVAWKNVVTAIGNLRDHGLLSFSAIHRTSTAELEPLIRSTLYYRMKALKLKAFATHLADRYGGDLHQMFDQALHPLREELLSLYGIGEETADDILLYAAELPSFVIDSYTKRVFERLGYVRRDIPYNLLRSWFMDHLAPDTPTYNQYHALIDAVGHHFCGMKVPKCQHCPLATVCEYPDT